MIIAIDGPSASGKSSVASLLAQRLNMYCINSGALYRAIAYVAKHVLNYDEGYFQEVTHEQFQELLFSQRLRYDFKRGACAKILFDNTDLTSFLATPLIAQGASVVSLNKDLRHILTTYFRKIAQDKDLVVEGRDIGTVVFPKAHAKFFLTAQFEIRAQRWQKMLEHQGTVMDLSQAFQELAARDERDKTRKIAPLVKAADAHEIDNSYLSIEQTVDLMISYIK